MPIRTLLAALSAALLFAVPAYAQEPIACDGVGDTTTSCTTGDDATAAPDPEATVGDGQVITDPADEVDPDTKGDGEADTGDEPKRGEIHVLGGAATASSRRKVAAPAAARPATQPTATAAPAATQRTAGGKTLPFTGVNGAYLALMGAALLATGYGLRRAVTA